MGSGHECLLELDTSRAEDTGYRALTLLVWFPGGLGMVVINQSLPVLPLDSEVHCLPVFHSQLVTCTVKA